MSLKMFQTKPQERKPAPKIAHVVAIAAGKGGVGKSTVTVNLALALKQAGYSVGIMDMDIYGPSVRRMLPEDTMPVQNGDKIIPAVCSGIRMISMAYFRKDNEAAAVRAPIANGLVGQFINQIEWGNLDFLLIDFPPGTGDIQLTLSQQANLCGAVMVTTPQEVAVMDVRRAFNLFEHVNVPVIGVVENMSYYTQPGTGEKAYLFGRGGGERLAQDIGVPFLGAIPIDAKICECCDKGISLFSDSHESDPATQAFTNVAESFIAHVTALK
ncbi:MAG TPA: Mrp/NBP35 family ATP-binding protein, partial [Parachlamydiaceae bacterium]|nr:Mrp/NBP35 family ATP-binding protein [Parachlamydiaceae bacterium]